MLFLIFSLAIRINSLTNGNSGFKSISKLNTSAYNKFIVIAIRKKSVYIATSKDDKQQCTHEMV